jgi:hypothetical protein
LYNYPSQFFFMTTLPVASAYREAIWISIILQVLTTLFLLSILDGGTLARAGGCAMAAFWIGAAIVIIAGRAIPASSICSTFAGDI